MEKKCVRRYVTVFALSIMTILCAARANAQGFSVKSLELRSPTPGAPFYHFAAKLDLEQPGPVFIHEIKVNGEIERNFFFVEQGEPFPEGDPRTLRRLAISDAIKSPRPERSFTRPTLYARANWHNGQTCHVELTASLGAKENPAATVSVDAVAPETGGYWNDQWPHYQSVVLTEHSGAARVNEPVKTTFLYYPDQMSDPAREIRVVHFDSRKRTHAELPFQLLDAGKVQNEEAPMYNEHGELKPKTFLPTNSATIMFAANVPANGSSVYLIFFGNTQAAAPQYASGLQVTGEGPGVAIENPYYKLKMHALNGMLDEVTLKSHPEFTFVHKKETNGAVQWNPDAYSPPRAWVHLSDWDPSKYEYAFEEQRGPVVYRTRRWGQMPQMPEIDVSMEYEFYANTPYFKMRSSMYIRHDVAVQALRNAEVVFARESFTDAAWWDPIRERIETRAITSAPDLTEWIMPDTTPWLAFFNPQIGCGYGGIQTGYQNGSLVADLRTLNPYMYVTTGPWVYWTRALAYPYGSRNPQQLIEIKAGSVFLEEWVYLPFELGEKEAGRFAPMQQWRRRLQHPLELHLEEPIDPRMQIPEEIYIEPTATGWEQDGGHK